VPKKQGPPGSEDPADVAEAANLRYVTDAAPGIRRRRQGKGFAYVALDGTPIKDKADLRRIRTLAIPPAWTEVWICPNPLGHIQATGRDARGRKQYRYHARWRQTRDETKYGRMIAFAKLLPRIRRRVARDLRRRGLPREKVLATVVRLLETTLIRVGNEEYAKENQSFGLTTMRTRHVRVKGSKLSFRFKGKSGREHVLDVTDVHLARIVRQCRDLPGQELFQYVDEEGIARTVGSDDVNEYLRDVSGQDFTAKDFRTWAGTVLASQALREIEAFDTEAQAKQNVVRAIEAVAKRLGNTRAVCRKCYVHPAIIDAYVDGTMLQTLKRRAEREMKESLHGLRAEEAAVLGILQQRLTRESRERRAAA
jgi:DNA topoisomerase-1